MPTLRHINPIGAMYVPLIGRALEPGEEFEVSDDHAARLLDQPTNYELVSADLGSLTVEQLREYAEARDIDLTGKSTKGEIVAAIEKG